MLCSEKVQNSATVRKVGSLNRNYVQELQLSEQCVLVQEFMNSVPIGAGQRGWGPPGASPNTHHLSLNGWCWQEILSVNM